MHGGLDFADWLYAQCFSHILEPYHKCSAKGPGRPASGDGQKVVGICSLQLPGSTGQEMGAAE